MNVSRGVASRLVRTETAHVANQADFQAYKELGIEMYRYSANFDERTCDICGELDGQVFPMSEKREGKNAPTMHPHCRCNTIAEYDEEILKQWTRLAIDPVTGDRVMIPRNITYSEWLKTQKEHYGPERVEAAQKMHKNKTADMEQYGRYKKVIGKDAGKTFADFQKMKYNGDGQWEGLKAKYLNTNAKTKAKDAIAEAPKNVKAGQQNKHVLGSNEYKQEAAKYAQKGQYGPGWVYDGIEGAQEIAKKYSGTGDPEIKKGIWTNNEVVQTAGEPVGIVVNNRDGKEAETTVAKIHYAKDGLHVVPDYPSKRR